MEALPVPPITQLHSRCDSARGRELVDDLPADPVDERVVRALHSQLLADPFPARQRVLETMSFGDAWLAADDALPVPLVAQLRLTLMRDGQMTELIPDFLRHVGEDGPVSQRISNEKRVYPTLLPAHGFATLLPTNHSRSWREPNRTAKAAPLSADSRPNVFRWSFGVSCCLQSANTLKQNVGACL